MEDNEADVSTPSESCSTERSPIIWGVQVEPNWRQQGKILFVLDSGNYGSLSKPEVSIREEDRRRILEKIISGDERGDFKLLLEHIRLPDQGRAESQLSSILNNDVYKKLLADFIEKLGSIRESSPRPNKLTASGLVGYLRSFEEPISLEAIIDDFLGGIEDGGNSQELQKAEELIHQLMHVVYGKRWEYYLQILLLRREAIQKGVENYLNATKMEVLNNEGEDVIEQAEVAGIDGSEFKGRKLTVDVLKEKGLIPVHKITIGKDTFYFSRPFYLLGGRIGVIAYLRTETGISVRSYYLSNSHGVWRLLPDYTVVHKDGEDKLGWYGKGYDEESLNLPIPVQRALAEIISSPDGILRISDPDFVFAGTAKCFSPDQSNGNKADYYKLTSKEPRLSLSSQSEEEIRIQNLTGRRKKIKPTEMRIRKSLSPDFSSLLAKWRAPSQLYKEIEYYVFPSNDWSLLYIFCRDREGHVWIASVGSTENLAVEATGLHREWVKAGDLATSPYQYPNQAGRWADMKDVKEGYVGMRKYISEIPIIPEFEEWLSN